MDVAGRVSTWRGRLEQSSCRGEQRDVRGRPVDGRGARASPDVFRAGAALAGGWPLTRPDFLVTIGQRASDERQEREEGGERHRRSGTPFFSSGAWACGCVKTVRWPLKLGGTREQKRATAATLELSVAARERSCCSSPVRAIIHWHTIRCVPPSRRSLCDSVGPTRRGRCRTGRLAERGTDSRQHDTPAP
jgi:hypothetical protein